MKHVIDELNYYINKVENLLEALFQSGKMIRKLRIEYAFINYVLNGTIVWVIN